MSLYDSASLVMIPSGYKAGKLYSIKPTNGVGDFTVARASIASRINDDGLIENVAANVPRINYPSCPSLLLEPARTNLITYPVSFFNSYWTKTNANISGDQSTLGADLLSGWDFTSGWTSVTATINNSQNFTTAGAGGVYKDSNILEVGQLYELTIAGNTTSARLDLYNYYGGGSIIKEFGGTFNQTFLFTTDSVSTNCLFFRNINAGTTQIDTLILKKISGFASPHADYPTDAFKLTASANNGTLRRINTGTSAVDYSNSFYVKRISGTGTVFLIDPNNVDVEITPNDTWQRFDGFTETLSTSIYSGIKLATSGDEVMIAFSQAEQGNYPTSFIYDGTEGATVNRAVDSAIVSDLIVNGILTATEGTIVDNRDGVSYAYRYTSDGNMESFIDGVSQGSVVQAVPTSYSLVVPSKTEQLLMFPTPLTDEEIIDLTT